MLHITWAWSPSSLSFRVFPVPLFLLAIIISLKKKKSFNSKTRLGSWSYNSEKSSKNRWFLHLQCEGKWTSKISSSLQFQCVPFFPSCSLNSSKRVYGMKSSPKTQKHWEAHMGILYLIQITPYRRTVRKRNGGWFQEYLFFGLPALPGSLSYQENSEFKMTYW